MGFTLNRPMSLLSRLFKYSVEMSEFGSSLNVPGGFMKKITFLAITVSILVLGQSGIAGAEVFFDFEHGNQGWKIPEWTDGRDDYVGKMIEVTTERFLDENIALKIDCDFPKQSWAAAIVEFEAKQGLEGGTVTADVYLPAKARRTYLKARVIATVGHDWKVMEGKAVSLEAGKWNRISTRFEDFRPASDGPIRSEDIKKIAIRIERDASPWDTVKRYKGSVYIDNVVVEKS